MFRKVDCLRIHVPSIENALEFYRDKLGLKLVWRRGVVEAGLRMRDSDTELVLTTENVVGTEADVLVESADLTAKEFEKLGGRIVVPPFNIAIGRCAVLKDTWNNQFVVLDMGKGPLRTDSFGDVLSSDGKKRQL